MALQGKMTTPKSIQVTSLSHVPSQKLSQLVDVDTSAQEDGSIIMWDNASGTYKVRRDVEHPNLFIIGGSF